jgi:hypothetical protein
MIPFIRNRRTGAIHISYSGNPKSRLASLKKQAVGDELELLGHAHGNYDARDAYWDRFLKHHVEESWFSGAILPDVMAIVEKAKTEVPKINVMLAADNEFATLYSNESTVFQALSELHRTSPIDWLVIAGERHLETAARKWATQNKVSVQSYYPTWSTKGKFAGFAAARKMLRARFDNKVLLAFLVGDGSTTMKSLMKSAEKLKIRMVKKAVKGRVAGVW